ncbi:MAG: hypothetical protein M3032_06510 [Verrucomicrobiota bacterium]|nr:hypothetical protein [Verrucomicrobiota bacterium]
MKRGDLQSLGATLLALVFVLCWGRAHLDAQTPSPSPSATIVLRNIGVIPAPTTPPPRRPAAQPDEEEKPIPRNWLIGGGIAAVLATIGLSYGAQRVWRSSNLFDRQYRFPRSENVALRFGAERCGGHLASVKFETPRSRRSETKDL